MPAISWRLTGGALGVLLPGGRGLEPRLGARIVAEVPLELRLPDQRLLLHALRRPSDIRLITPSLIVMTCLKQKGKRGARTCGCVGSRTSFIAVGDLSFSPTAVPVTTNANGWPSKPFFAPTFDAFSSKLPHSSGRPSTAGSGASWSAKVQRLP